MIRNVKSFFIEIKNSQTEFILQLIPGTAACADGEFAAITTAILRPENSNVRRSAVRWPMGSVPLRSTPSLPLSCSSAARTAGQRAPPSNAAEGGHTHCHLTAHPPPRVSFLFLPELPREGTRFVLDIAGLITISFYFFPP